MAAMDMKDMDRWAADDWAAFGLSLWELHGNIVADPAYIDAGVDILVGLRAALPHINLALRKYCADTADVIANLCCERLRGLADDCRWTTTQAASMAMGDSPDVEQPEENGEDLGIPPEWFDDLDDDGDDD